jgi:hypothetical protein
MRTVSHLEEKKARDLERLASSCLNEYPGANPDVVRFLKCEQSDTSSKLEGEVAIY